MKKTLKVVLLALSGVLAVGAFCGCGKKETAHNDDELTYWVPLDSSTGETLSSFNDLYMYQEMEKATGIKVNFIHPASGSSGSEAFQILLSSGDYPDMIEYYWDNYSGGADQAIKDGVIISLNDYLKDYAPNYYNYMEGEAGKENGYLYKAAALSTEKNYYGFKNLNEGPYRGYMGLYVRKDLLDKWGLEVPTTIDDWTNLFRVAKENGVKYPMTGAKYILGALGCDVFNTAWEVGTSFYMDGDEVKFGPFEPEFKEYVMQMMEWMKAGYLDIDYITNDTPTIQGQMTNGNSVASFGYVGGDLGALIPAMEERNPDYDLVACPFPVMHKGDVPIFQALQPEASDPSVAVTVQCGKKDEERYKKAIKWCDYLYSDEGKVLKSFGKEGDTFTIEKDKDGNDHYVYTDKIKNYKEFGATNMSAAIFHFVLPANHPGFNQHPDYFNGYYSYQQQKDAINTWNEYVDVAKKHVLPPISYTADEAAKKANIESKAKDNLIAAISNIILGKASIDTYESAIEQARKDGYGELLEITQDAYDRYISVVKDMQ